MSILYRFSDCELVPLQRRLTVRGRPARLGGRAFDLLVALIDRRDRVVGKEELYELIWPSVAVEPNNLQVQVWALRRLLGPQVLVTVARRGYRFTPLVEVVPLGPPIAAAPALAGAAIDLASHSQWPGLSAPPANMLLNGDALTKLRALHALHALLAQHRLVSVVSANTAAALHLVRDLAKRLAPELAGGVWQLPITGAEATAMPRQPLAPGLTQLPALAARLGARPALWVLADAHRAPCLVATVAQQALDVAPQLRIVATAPARLGLALERSLDLPLFDAPANQLAWPGQWAREGPLRWNPR